MKRAAFLLAVALATPAWAGDEVDYSDAPRPKPVPVIKNVPAVERLTPIVQPQPVAPPPAGRNEGACKIKDYVTVKATNGTYIMTCHPWRYTKYLPPAPDQVIASPTVPAPKPEPAPVPTCALTSSTFDPVKEERKLAPYLAAARADMQAGNTVVSLQVNMYKHVWVEAVKSGNVAEITDYKQCLLGLRKRTEQENAWLQAWTRLQTYVQP